MHPLSMTDSVRLGRALALAATVWLGFWSTLAADPPRLLRSAPANGATNVSAEVGKLVITFDRNMRVGSHSLVEVAGKPFPPMIASEDPWPDPVTFVLRLKALVPGTTYAVQLNSRQRRGFVSADDGVPLEPTVIAFTVAPLQAGEAGVAESQAGHPGIKPDQAGATAGGRPVALMLRRQFEPRQRAFSVLVPEGWQLEGGMFSVDPTQAGGAGNSIETKCDLAVKRDAAGSVVARWLPSYNYADFSGSFEFANLGLMFPPGRVYNGMQVRPLPTVEGFLSALFKALHPQAQDVTITQRVDLPELVEICQELARGANQQIAMLGKPGMVFTAGAIVVEYTEDGAAYREALATVIDDFRGAAAQWSNQFTFMMRAPRGEADRWKPVLDIVRQSIQFNPEWVAQYVRSVGERGAAAAETLRHLARIDQEIFERRSKTRSDIQHENYLLLTGQEDYLNPFTKEVERDTSDYKHRWTTAGGDRFYSESETFDPNRDPAFNRLEWQRTPVQPR